MHTVCTYTVRACTTICAVKHSSMHTRREQRIFFFTHSCTHTPQALVCSLRTWLGLSKSCIHCRLKKKKKIFHTKQKSPWPFQTDKLFQPHLLLEWMPAFSWLFRKQIWHALICGILIKRYNGTNRDPGYGLKMGFKLLPKEYLGRKEFQFPEI